MLNIGNNLRADYFIACGLYEDLASRLIGGVKSVWRGLPAVGYKEAREGEGGKDYCPRIAVLRALELKGKAE